MPHWTTANIPDLTGKTALITGASSGIGAAAAAAFAAKGATTVLAVRDIARGETIAARILAQTPGATLAIERLDLADLASIRAFAERMSGTRPRIDILLNNAGLGMQPVRSETKDGFERQFGTNHLGHFALTGRLIPALLRAPAPRVVTIASLAHRRGKIDFDDLQSKRNYAGGRAYSQSKLANILFALELNSRAAGSGLISVAAHPGISATGFLAAIGLPKYQEATGQFVMQAIGQDAAHGALPGLYAATMPSVKGGQYWGPDGFMEMRGSPALAKLSAAAQDRETQARLWRVSEELTGVYYPAFA